MTLQFITHGYIRLDQNMNNLILTHAHKKLIPGSSIGLIFLSRRNNFEAIMLLHSNVITRIQIISKVLSTDLLYTKLKFLVPLSIVCSNDNPGLTLTYFRARSNFVTKAFL